MKICLDVSAAVHRRAGIGRYTYELTAALVALDAENTYTLFYNRPAAAHLDPPLDRLPALTTPSGNKPWRMRALLSHALPFLRDRRFADVDLFHATDNLLPHLSGAKGILTLHDFAFLLYPQTHTRANRWFLRLAMPRFVRAADAVIAVSETTKRDAMRLYGLDEKKVRVIYEGVSPRFRRASPEAVQELRRRLRLPERFILYVGTIEPRKNLPTLFAAFQRARLEGIWLVVAGKAGWLYRETLARLRTLGIEGNVLFTGYVPDADLPTLYSAADLFVYPSLYEGFGLPPLEAMACGVPVISSDAPGLAETVGEAGLLVPPREVDDWAAALVQGLHDAALRDELRRRGLQRASQFTWEAAARQTLALYRAVVGWPP